MALWDEIFEALTNPLVRDLAWVIGSAPLIKIDSPAQQFSTQDWQAMLHAFEAQLYALEYDSSELERWMEAYQDKRLGAYFARLFSFWLRHTHEFTVIAEQLAIRNAQKRTLGEFDLIVQNNATQKIEHWEIAVKFYLGLSENAPPHQWLGPGLKDSLGRKLSHLVNHQTQLSSLDEARFELEGKGIKIDTTRIILKGRLFYPWHHAEQNKHHCWWLRRSQLPNFLLAQQKMNVDAFAELNKRRWLAPLKYSNLEHIFRADELEAINPNKWNVPSHFVGFQNDLEHVRFFIVNDAWPSTELS